MNIDFNSISKFCITKNQKKNVLALEKKFSFKNSKDREKLTDLLGSFFVNKIYEPFDVLIPKLLHVQFEENFEVWGDVEYILGLANLSPSITEIQKNQFFALLESVKQYKSKKDAQEGLNNYFSKHLSLYFVKESLNDIQEAIEDNDSEYEYFMRLGAVSSASLVKIINQNENESLNNNMNNIISEQMTYLSENRLLQYS